MLEFIKSNNQIAMTPPRIVRFRFFLNLVQSLITLQPIHYISKFSGSQSQNVQLTA